jgi:hypothetical protein
VHLTRTLLTDRTGLITTVGGLAAGLPHPLVLFVVGLRLLVPVVLILHAGRGATPAERMSLVRDYLYLTGGGQRSAGCSTPSDPRPERAVRRNRLELDQVSWRRRRRP